MILAQTTEGMNRYAANIDHYVKRLGGDRQKLETLADDVKARSN